MSVISEINWTVSGLQDQDIISLITISNYILAGTNGSGIFTSLNNGVNWNQVNIGLKAQFINALEKSGNNIFAGTYGGIYISGNAGENWSTSNNGLTNFVINSIIKKDNFLFAGSDSGVFLSSNNGENWYTAGLSEKSVKVLVSGNNNIFAGTNGSGVFLSSNNGSSWNAAGLPNQYVTSLVIKGNYILAGILGFGIYKTSDNGGSWIPVNNGLTNTDVTSLGLSGNILFAGTYNSSFKSTDDGANWTEAGLTDRIVFTIYSTENNLFAGTDDGVLMSTNNGNIWINKNQGMNTFTPVFSLVVADDFIFSGTGSQSVWKRSISEITGIKNITGNITVTYSLSQNYPNPFNPLTHLEFGISDLGFVSLRVYNALGKEVAVLVNEIKNPGRYKVDFDGSGLASGIYFYKLESGDFVMTKKMLLIK